MQLRRRPKTTVETERKIVLQRKKKIRKPAQMIKNFIQKQYFRTFYDQGKKVKIVVKKKPKTQKVQIQEPIFIQPTRELIEQNLADFITIEYKNCQNFN